MKSHEIRESFLKYFGQHQHERVASSRLTPDNDPTLLFTNAGMNQFKNLFLGHEKRSYTRAASSQKCVRAGGKHNDLENVGHTARHHTFFEMLGNFSFGDYFKKEAIHFAWEYVTKTVGLPKDKLYVTVFQDDDEAADIWHKQEGVPKDRIYRFGEKDNFWRMGDSGPCGPCSEIFYDLGPEIPGDPKENVMGGAGDRFMEFWNLVFMQYHEDGKGGRFSLPKPSVDTGMGLERLTTILQGQLSNYHTDLFLDLMNAASDLCKVEYVKDTKKIKDSARERQDEINVALRVLADHARAAAFLIGDGVLPSNDGRGYVLRRILRRAIRFGRKLSVDQSLLPVVVEKVISKMGPVYNELNAQKALITTTVRDEESRFLSTLDQGTSILNEELKRLGNSGTLNGEIAFKLYDTYGFPLDLTRLMAAEKGYRLDEGGFETSMEQSREKARASWKGKGLSGDAAHLIQVTQGLKKIHGATTFVGYETTTLNEVALLLVSDGKMEQKILKAEQSGMMFFSQTPFYAEGGGQVGDAGLIRGPMGTAEVLDCTKQNDIFVHHVRVTDGQFNIGEVCQLLVTDSRRRATANNHSATHLMHSALRKILGTHVTQAGSLVDSERLRFDFTHNKPLTLNEIQSIEDLVNQEIGAARPVETKLMKHPEAVKAGAIAMFGEKYGDEVRVVRMGDFSMELCGGTHVANTSAIRLFKVISEGGVSSGVRRIEAITGEAAVQFAIWSTRENLAAREVSGTQESYAKFMSEGPRQGRMQLVKWIEQAKEEKKQLERQLQGAKSQQIDVDRLVREAKSFSTNGKAGRLVFADLAVDDRKVLSDISDKLRDKLQSGVVVIVGQGEGSHPVIVSVSKNLLPDVNAGKLLGEVAAAMGGKGGGRPDFAQGAAPDRGGLAEARKRADTFLGA
ncbi:MAG: alanine--tRNA ligase [Bdellovibrionales bacterium]